MFNKIQAQQIDLHTFSSPSGHFSIEQTDTEVKINLYSGITGNFNVVGSLFLNGGMVVAPHNSNTVGGVNGSRILAGQGNFVSGTDCAILAGASNEVSGVRNVVVNGVSSQITDNVADATAIGYGVLINNSHDGATVIADGRVATKNSKGQNTLNIDFENGMFVQNDLSINGDLNIGTNTVASGSMSVIGLLTYTGDQVATHRYTTGVVVNVSGILNSKVDVLSGFSVGFSGSLYDRIIATGNLLSNRISYDLDDLVRQTGNQVISGEKEFRGNIKISSESTIQGTGATPNFIIIEDDLAVDVSTGKNISLTSTDGCIILLDSNGDGNMNSSLNDFNTYWDNSFILVTGSTDADIGDTVFGIHPSGIAWTKESIILENRSSAALSANSDPGYSGQIKWVPNGTDSAYLQLFNGHKWITFTGHINV